jgi:hypothetical protein
MSDGCCGPRVPNSNGGHLIVCHAGSAAMGFIPDSKQIFCSKSKTSAVSHSEMKNSLCSTLLHIQVSSWTSIGF